MNFIKKIIIWFKTHNQLIHKDQWIDVYFNIPTIRDCTSYNTFEKVFDEIDTNKDDIISVWELIKFSFRLTKDIYKYCQNKK